jgi:hypothetical protein
MNNATLCCFSPIHMTFNVRTITSSAFLTSDLSEKIEQDNSSKHSMHLLLMMYTQTIF